MKASSTESLVNENSGGEEIANGSRAAIIFEPRSI